MIKLLFIALLFVTQTAESCKNCWGYTGRKLRRHAMENIPCDCNCAQQYHVRYDDRQGYGCIRCGHRLIPTNPLEKETEQAQPTVSKKITKDKKSNKNKRSVTYSSKRTNKNWPQK